MKIQGFGVVRIGSTGRDLGNNVKILTSLKKWLCSVTKRGGRQELKERGGRSRWVSPSPTDMQIAIGTY